MTTTYADQTTGIVSRLIAEADDAQTSYWNQITATEAAMRAVDEAQTALQVAERELDEVEAEVLLAVMVDPDGPINGKNEAVRKLQIADYLKDEPKYLNYRGVADDARLAVRNAKITFETESHKLTAIKHACESKTAQMQLVSAMNERS